MPTGMQAYAAVAAGGVTKKRAARSAAQGIRGGIRDGIRPAFATTRGLNEHAVRDRHDAVGDRDDGVVVRGEQHPDALLVGDAP